MTLCFAKRFTIALAALLIGATPHLVLAVDAADLQREFEELRQQNQKLHEQVQRQEKMIESLNERLSEVQTARTNLEVNSQIRREDVETKSDSGSGINFFGERLQISGEAGVGFFHTSSDGAFPNSEFRVDEARLFFDAKILDDVYFFTELNLTTREAYEEHVDMGEVYVDFENLSQHFGRDNWLSLRVGRFDIPFGEEYLVRDAIDNPLIQHSLADFWGIDEGVEIYGGIGKVNYVLAVQNGGVPKLHDYNSDKAVVGKISFAPKRWLYLSASGMRTGDLDVAGDETSELWFGQGFVRNIGGTATEFHADILQGDVQFLGPRNHLKLSGGYLRSDDNAPGQDNLRHSYFYSVEGLQKFGKKFYGAARFSQILVEDGTFVVGNGMFGKYFFNPANLTENIWRLSVGVGYRVNRHLLLKTEYSYEEGDLVGGRRRNANFFGAEAAVGF